MLILWNYNLLQGYHNEMLRMHSMKYYKYIKTIFLKYIWNNWSVDNTAYIFYQINVDGPSAAIVMRLSRDCHEKCHLQQVHDKLTPNSWQNWLKISNLRWPQSHPNLTPTSPQSHPNLIPNSNLMTKNSPSVLYSSPLLYL